MITSNLHCQHCSAPFIRKKANQSFCTETCRKQANQFATIVSLLNKHFVTIKDAAQMLGISASAVRTRIKRGELTSHQLLGRFYVRKSQLEASRERA